MGTKDSITTDNKLKVLIIGCTRLTRRIITSVEQTNTIVGVVNLHPEEGMLKSNYDTLSEFNSKNPDKFYMTRDINDDETYNWVKDKEPDLIIQCGWSQIFKKRILSTPKLFCIGFHPAPLPVGRGAAVLNWMIIENDNLAWGKVKDIEWGNTMFVMDEKTDTGDILDFEPFIIEGRDDINTTYFKVYKSSVKMIERTLPLIESGEYKRITQDNAKATRFYKRKPSDGLIKFDWSAHKILNWVRALTTPYPGAFFEYESKQIKLWRASIGYASNDVQSQTGTVIEIKKGKGVNVKINDSHTIWLEIISDINDLECWADEWAIENNLKVGEILE